MKKALIALFIAVFMVPQVSFAYTDTERLALIATLLEQVKVLQAQLDRLLEQQKTQVKLVEYGEVSGSPVATDAIVVVPEEPEQFVGCTYSRKGQLVWAEKSDGTVVQGIKPSHPWGYEKACGAF